MGLTILVLEEIEQTRRGIEELLTRDGYVVLAAKDEAEAVECALGSRPDLILVSRGDLSCDVIRTATRIRERAEVGDAVPVVIFCMEEVEEGGEVEIERNICLTMPDNFNQLRQLIERLLSRVANFKLV